MRYFTRTAAGAVAACLLAGLPIASLADSGAHQTTYTTTMTESQPLPSYAPFGGQLRLTTEPGGEINGYYIPDDQTNFIPVIGGVQNGQMWLTIGNSGDLRIVATVEKDGSLVGSATDERSVPIDGQLQAPVDFDFIAKPSAG
jgi:hypothetical protein